MASQGKKMESNFELDRDSFEVQKAWRQFDAPFSSETLKETAADLLLRADSHTLNILNSKEVGLEIGHCNAFCVYLF